MGLFEMIHRRNRSLSVTASNLYYKPLYMPCPLPYYH